MFKRTFLFLLFVYFATQSIAATKPLTMDSLVYSLQLKDNKKLVSYINTYFVTIPVDSINNAEARIHQYFFKYNVENGPALELFISSIYQNRLLHTTEAKNELLKAIDIADRTPDHYLLYNFLSHLAFIQTYEGNAIEAISSFRAARKEAIILDDPYLEVIININISDIYYRYDFYAQSLYYLDQAQQIIVGQHVHEHRLANIIYYNKAENYFRMKQLDSLEAYSAKLKNSKDKAYKLYTYTKRSNYYVHLLKHDYTNAITLIKGLATDTLYKFENLDKQNLADAYFNGSMPDSAKQIIEKLLVDKAQNNHPEIKYHLYEVLGEIAEKENNPIQAAYNFKMALQQSKENVSKLIQVGDISSRMKVEDVEKSYIQKDQIYKRERLILIFMVIVALLIIVVITMFYRNAKQKRHYEKLLFVAKREELAYINSHDIRRHLTNILGIIDVIQHSDNKEKEYNQLQERLFYSAQQLDEAIKNISEKLNEDSE